MKTLVATALAALAFAIPAAAEPQARVSFSPASKSVFEGDGAQTRHLIGVSMPAALSETVTVRVVSSSVQATAGVDYLPLSETLTFVAGETHKTVAFTTLGDVKTEATEAISIVALQNGVERARMQFEIYDDDPRPAAYGDNIRVSEGNGNPAVFRIWINRPAKFETRFDYATVDGTAIAGQDYYPTSGTLVIPPFTSTVEIRVQTIGDTLVEPDETFTLRLTNAVEMDAIRESIRATIVNDDVPPPPFALSAPAIYEGDSGTKPVPVRVSMATASSSPVTVTVTTTGSGSARAGEDYVSLSQSLTFPPGITERTVDVTIIGDTLVEGEETFWVNVLQDGVVRVAQKVRIRDDDDPRPAVSIGDVEVREGDTTPVTATFQVTLSKAPEQLVRVAWQTVEGTASLLDYSHGAGVLLFQPGETTKTIRIDVTGDRTREENETFTIELANPEGSILGDESGVCTILDNDGNGKRRAARH